MLQSVFFSVLFLGTAAAGAVAVQSDTLATHAVPDQLLAITLSGLVVLGINLYKRQTSDQ
ncbi:hypothetical protein [Ferrimonas marina]|uniref:PEP-CTERM protein-sorting domain-containing protein n=1 Tax=Ferrimonas marina TaxID=299255 RepID=A0A1M5TYT7_9GAMM|nr:hypothetical protein [Ferrimonas marina]SHH55947.1 hypothetical protein SAMN02745129_2336 [Ferrimonas marina]